MQNLLGVLLFLCLLGGCATKKENPPPRGPFFYMSAPSNDGYEPPGDLSETEAKEIAARGYPYYVAYFDSKGKPEKILKVSNRETEVLKD